jgi:hypothetical protein
MMKSHFDDKPDTRLYSILPARAVQDDELPHMTLRVLGALCLHSNGAGVCWPSRMTLGRHVNRAKNTISRHVSILVKAGYVRFINASPAPFWRASRTPPGSIEIPLPRLTKPGAWPLPASSPTR